MLAWVRKFPTLSPSSIPVYHAHHSVLTHVPSCPPQHTFIASSYSCLYFSQSPTSNLQSLTCFNPVIIILPLHITKLSQLLFLLNTSETLSIPSRCLNSSNDFLSFSVTPHIYLTIILSALSSLCLSSTFIGKVTLPYII